MTEFFIRIFQVMNYNKNQKTPSNFDFTTTQIKTSSVKLKKKR